MFGGVVTVLSSDGTAKALEVVKCVASASGVPGAEELVNTIAALQNLLREARCCKVSNEHRCSCSNAHAWSTLIL
jgi:translation initiation factor 2B subunit (eIF-2B alpha/beta/delta family)